MEKLHFTNILEYINTPNKYLISPFIIFIGGYHYFTRRRILERNIEISRIKEDNENYLQRKERELFLIKGENDSLKEINKSLSYDNGKMISEIHELYEKIKYNGRIISEKDDLIKISNDKLEKIYNKKLKEKENKTNLKDCGSGELRYKSKCGTIYYHGMGHLERKYMWWDIKMNKNIIEYKNKDRKLKFPQFETHDINTFCNNCEYSEENNKNQRNRFFYLCKGHKINID
jgi:hypothetical protein